MSDLAATISIGDELLAGESLDTHGGTIAAALGDRGVRVISHEVVGDDVVVEHVWAASVVEMSDFPPEGSRKGGVRVKVDCTPRRSH